MRCDALGAERPLETTSETVILPPPASGNTAVQNAIGSDAEVRCAILRQVQVDLQNLRSFGVRVDAMLLNDGVINESGPPIMTPQDQAEWIRRNDAAIRAAAETTADEGVMVKHYPC